MDTPLIVYCGRQKGLEYGIEQTSFMKVAFSKDSTRLVIGTLAANRLLWRPRAGEAIAFPGPLIFSSLHDWEKTRGKD